ncbi:hypothetical protein RTH74_15235 [Pseudomonas sp. zfem001]|uniref:DUF6957 family protein n=1 Tax=Pseudomonas sp. zfem001 TaxID=3078196 RepID=UPI0029284DD1|nr:hypothetical protein [Pseudomonas sp. zfem001]MDU9408956.1 hypothetical protein [Pseudomonas sp. zfem001]
MDDLQTITDLLYCPGEPMAGSGMTDEQALAYARERFSYFEFCLVRHWLWIDLDVTDAQRVELEKTRRQPVILYAHQVIYDSARRWDVGDVVRTSPLVSFEDDFLFRTLNSVYLLLGDGQRKRSTLETVGRIF